MAFKDDGRHVMLSELATVAVYASLHSAYPATSGNEINGGSPAYARKAITWATPASGAMALNGTLPTFDVPAGATVAAVGFWSALTNGTLYADDDVTSESFAGQGTYALSSGQVSIT